MYAPERDLAYVAPTLLRAAIDSLDPQRITPSLRSYMIRHEITDEQLADAIQKIAEAQALFVGTLDVTTPHEALEAVGFLDVHNDVQGVVLAAFGRVLLAAWFKSVRETTHIQDAPTSQEDISRYYFAAMHTAANLRGEAFDVSQYAPQVEAAVLAEQLRHLRNYHSELLQKLKTERKRHQSLSQDYNACLMELASLKARPLYRLMTAIRRGWARLRRR